MDAATAAACDAYAERLAVAHGPLPDHVINDCADLLAATTKREGDLAAAV